MALAPLLRQLNSQLTTFSRTPTSAHSRESFLKDGPRRNGLLVRKNAIYHNKLTILCPLLADDPFDPLKDQNKKK